ncbi:type II secretion system F family protein [Desulfovibrio sp.]|uniref:type II secretion system F family protein n=1 Tax=Desulfovibrio sp. TaxID=885 RepID=UPI0025C049D8|nr:type II secretion system F family protein [Desulfovibrio sp.]
MANFCYRAIDGRGRNAKGMIEAGSQRLAVSLLHERGLVPLSVSPAASSGAASVVAAVGARPGFRTCLMQRLRPVSKAVVAGMARQLATLLRAGLPLDEALSAICAHGDDSALSGIVAHLRDRILSGGDLADGLAEFPRVFSSTFVTMVRAGEASGTLEIVVERFAEHIEQQVALQRKVQATLAYPVLMLVVGTGVVVFLLTFVIPKVTRIFADMGRELPLPTRILLGVSDTLRAGWWVFPLLILLAALAVWRIRQSPEGRRRIQRKILRCPGIRGVYRPLLVGHMTRTLGMLLKNGVSLLKALRIVRSAADNPLMAEAVQNMIDGVQAGRDLSGYMDNAVLFPPLARQMVAAGERSGQLDEMLLWVAGDCENRVAARLQMLTSLMEPVMILILGGLVGFVVIAIIMPIFEMSSLVG